MNSLAGVCVWMTLLAAVAGAQLQPAKAPLRPAGVGEPQSAVMGPVVTGAPYVADAIEASTQALLDGTTIRSERKYRISRDGQGRIRRDEPGKVWVWDPVAKLTYVLDPASRTATRMALRSMVPATAADGRIDGYVQGDGGVGELQAQIARVEAGLASPTKVPAIGPQGARVPSGAVPAPGGETRVEHLGIRTVEGVACEGTRETLRLAVGAVGNDRPIEIVTERWYSAELHTVISRRHSDPRTGEESFQLTHVRRGEPEPGLFQVPANYLISNK